MQDQEDSKRGPVAEEMVNRSDQEKQARLHSSFKTRREFLKATGLITASVAAVALPGSEARAQQPTKSGASETSTPTGPAKVISDSNFEQWKSRTVAELATVDNGTILAEKAERHSIYSLALMAITAHYWNGNKYGRAMQYPLNEPVPPANPGKLGDDYVGHNIAALIVDGDGLIIDFDFNHNELFNSSVEHAESRLLRRVFSLSQIQDSWNTGRPPLTDRQHYSTLLRNVSVYTTLESCAQCSGIMALATLEKVIFLQTDPGQYSIGNIMRNMTVKTGLQAPEPIPASAFGFSRFDELNRAYQSFRERPKTKQYAMVLDRDGKETRDSYTTSITSFLCTKSARDIFKRAADDLRTFQVKYPAWKPDAAVTSSLMNKDVLAEAQNFVEYACLEARRGTPHRA